jgi:hypothetical protein
MDVLEYLKSLEKESVEEVNMDHFLEHLAGEERISLMNEVYRILIPKGIVHISCPIWSHERAYGDPTHKWPPISTWTFIYLNKEWRDQNAPHCGYTRNFNWAVAGTHDPNDQWLMGRNLETKTVLMSRNINSTTDIIATLNKI